MHDPVGALVGIGTGADVGATTGAIVGDTTGTIGMAVGARFGIIVGLGVPGQLTTTPLTVTAPLPAADVLSKSEEPAPFTLTRP